MPGPPRIWLKPGRQVRLHLDQTAASRFCLQRWNLDAAALEMNVVPLQALDLSPAQAGEAAEEPVGEGLFGRGFEQLCDLFWREDSDCGARLNFLDLFNRVALAPFALNGVTEQSRDPKPKGVSIEGLETSQPRVYLAARDVGYCWSSKLSANRFNLTRRSFR